MEISVTGHRARLLVTRRSRRPRLLPVIATTLAIAVGCAGKGHTAEKPPTPAGLPDACGDTPAAQSPALFTAGGVQPVEATTCDVAGSRWVPCHQHMHCGPEHGGAGICESADCEVHTVYRRRKDGADAAPVTDVHEGTVGGNCEPAQHDLMVRATFVDLGAGCDAGAASNLTYCGSATGNDTLDTNKDGAVSCAESGISPVSVRWCVETACECRSGSSIEALEAELGRDEATRVRGCPGAP